jgi:ElaB/YqjD/DUF883 family membrane-anchored ribosome-binding protein
MKQHAKDEIDSVLNRASASAHQAINSAKDVAQPAADWLGEQVDGATASRKKYVGESSRYISKNPLKSVAVAVVAGFFISKLIR